jgi:hypothetical protein
MRKLGWVLTGIGVMLLLAGSLALVQFGRFLRASRPAEGVVLGESPAADGATPGARVLTVRFQTEKGDPITLNIPRAETEPPRRVGDRLRLRYLPDEPERVLWGQGLSLWLPVLAPGALGLLLALPGGMLVGRAWRHAARARWLARHGRLISTELQAVQSGRARGAPGRTTYRIVSNWRDPVSGRYYAFVSPPLETDPEPYLHGRAIPVRIDPDRPAYYRMDTSFVPGGS